MTNPNPSRDHLREAVESHTIRALTEEDAGRGIASITAELARGNMVNRNGRYYPTAVLASAAEAANAKASEGAFNGLRDHPGDRDSAKGTYSDTVIKWDRVWMEGDKMMGAGVIADTRHGRDTLALKKTGMRLGLSTNGYAALHFEPASEYADAGWTGDPDDWVAVIDSLDLLTVDLVTDPSNVYAEIRQEAAMMRESARAAGEEHHSMRNDATTEGGNEATETNERHDELLLERAELMARVEELEDELRTMTARAMVAERHDLITQVAQGRALSENQRNIAYLLAESAATTEEAQERVADFIVSLDDRPAPATESKHGNNHVPASTDEPGADALTEARAEMGVTA